MQSLLFFLAYCRRVPFLIGSWLLRRCLNQPSYTIAINMAGCGPMVGGVGNYAASLIRGWARYIPWNPLSLYCTASNFHEVRKFPLWYRLKHHCLYNEKDLCALEGKFDLLYAPFGSVTPIPPPHPFAFHFADIQDYFFPEFFSLKSLCFRRNAYRNARAFADHILAPSEFSKKSMVACLQIPEDRISVVPLPVADLPSKAIPPSNLHDRETPFLYYPADNYAHKNHQRLFLAIAELVKQGWSGHLICTGTRVPGKVDLVALAKTSGISDSFIDLGKISREEVSWLYKQACFLIFPSLFEGYGLPIIEAFTMGLPVLCSGVTSLPELGGDAVLYCNPFDVSDITEKIWLLWNDAQLRATLASRGKKRQKIFSTKHIVKQHLAIFMKVIHESRTAKKITPPAHTLPEIDLKLAETLYKEGAHEKIYNHIPPRDHWFPKDEVAGMKDHGTHFSLQHTPPLLCSNSFVPVKIKNAQRLPIHFFTIVHNGIPFIKKHLEVFQQLTCEWHWHIIEGAALLEGDTSWSLNNGGRLPENSSILSNDGTSDYLDSIAEKYPEKISLYRKNDFWKGKLEMISAPLSHLPKQALLWEVDVDEMWNAAQIMTLVEEFAQDPTRTGALFYCRFFVAPDRILDNIGFYGNNPSQEWRRVWNYKQGDMWKTHAPPCLLREVELGDFQDVMTLHPFTQEETWKMGLVFDHLAYTTEEQLRFKEAYYGYQGATAAWKEMMQSSDPDVFVSNYFSWIQDPVWAIKSIKNEKK
ncbi:MAG: glycosyltransferase family 1 protein [Verrucomicrobiae bacterium]|nr:glycosyltransferase family 1 protein [Verrucomicrobiae bacterium]